MMPEPSIRSGIYCFSDGQMQAALASRDAYQVELHQAGYGTITTEIWQLLIFTMARTITSNTWPRIRAAIVDSGNRHQLPVGVHLREGGGVRRHLKTQGPGTPAGRG